MPKIIKFLKTDAHWPWIRVILPLLATAALLVGLGVISMDVLSSVRAYVGGEGLYSKAQKDAVLFLSQYAKSHDESDYQKYLQAIAVPLGDHRARVALDRPEPDLAAARQGFRAAQNHPDDIAGMIRLFRNFRNVSFMNEVIGIWADADVYIEKLRNEGQRLHAGIASGQPDEAAIRSSIARIKLLNSGLNPMEVAFSSKLGDASRKTQDLLLWATLAIGTALMGIGSVISRSMLKKKEGVENALRISEERLNLAMRGNSDGLWDWNILEKSIYYSPRLMELMELSGSEAVYPEQHFSNFVHPEDVLVMRARLENYLRDNSIYDAEFRIITPSGKQLWVRSRAQAAYDAAGMPVRMAGSFTDITERKQAALDLTRSNRALQMLSRCNEAVMRAENEAELLDQVCHLAVDIGGYRLAWVAYAQEDEARSIAPAAQAGNPEDLALLNALRLSWSAEDAAGLGPVGRTIRGGAPVLFDDILPDPAALRSTYVALPGRCSGICLPLRDKGLPFGLLALYSSDALKVSAEETKLLQELADDLAFGISNIRAQNEQRRVQSAVLKIAAAVSASTGTAFFQQLVHNMAEALGASAGFVSRRVPGAPGTMRTIAGVINGRVADSLEYVILGCPCESLMAAEQFIVPEKLGQQFQLPAALMALDAQAYVGRRLDNSAGQAVGSVFVLFQEALKKPDFITSTLQIFAARAAAEMERQETDARIHDQASLLDKAQDAIIVRGMDQRVQFWNKSAERLYGWTQDEVLGRSTTDLLSDPADSFIEATNAVLDLGEWSGEIPKRRKDGSTLAVESRWTLVRDDAGVPQAILAIDTDITQRKAAELEILQLAFYDPLTQLPNRRLLMDRLQQALVTNARSRNTGALLFIDLDNFKTINDTLGHDRGDQLLQQVALRLAASVRVSDTVARLGGDEFVVMLLDLCEERHEEAAVQAMMVAEKILAALSQPYDVAGHKHHSTSSIGITLFNHQQDTVGELLKRADLAMYQAKGAGRNTIRFFDPEMQAVLSTRAALEADLRLALARGEFLLHYQPQVDAGASMTGVEALLRWQHPRRGMVAPADFIPLAEDTGLILPIGLWVLETACAQLAAWAARAQTRHLMMAVNVSVRQFRHPEFVAQVMAVLAASGADPFRLKLEITESLMVNDMEATIAKMTALKEVGVRFSLDDFGTGYSSLAYLKRLPLDQLKIDQSFVKDVLSDPNDAAIARTIVALAQSLGLDVIAEGVETEAQREFLAHHGCRAYQGYLFSRPLRIDKLEQFMRESVRSGRQRLA